MTGFDEYTNENKINHNPNWSYIRDHPYRILIIGASGSKKTNTLLNLIKNQLDIDKIYSYAKDPYEDKYQFLINRRENIGVKHFTDPKAFIECSYSKDKEKKILIGFDDMIADMISIKKLNFIVTELFIRGRKWNISLAFITQSYFKVPRDVKLNTTHFFIMKIPNKRELQQIAISHSSDINTKDFIKIYNKCTNKPYSFLVNDTTFSSDNPLRFRKHLYII